MTPRAPSTLHKLGLLGTLYFSQGFSAQALGYAGHFALGTVLALGAVAAVLAWFPRPVVEEEHRW